MKKKKPHEQYLKKGIYKGLKTENRKQQSKFYLVKERKIIFPLFPISYLFIFSDMKLLLKG